MKYLLVACLAIMLCGCNNSTEVKEGKLYLEGVPDFYSIRTFEYDGCEYISFGSGNSLTITHKGNCKYCQQRNK